MNIGPCGEGLGTILFIKDSRHTEALGMRLFSMYPKRIHTLGMCLDGNVVETLFESDEGKEMSQVALGLEII